MPWITFTNDIATSRISVRELENYEETATRESDGTPGVDERLPSIVSQVMGQFRGNIRSNPQVTFMGPEGTLPDFCIAPAAIICRVALIGLNPVQEGITDPRRDEYRDAVKVMESLKSINPKAFEEDDPSSVPSNPTYGGSTLIEF